MRDFEKKQIKVVDLDDGSRDEMEEIKPFSETGEISRKRQIKIITFIDDNYQGQAKCERKRPSLLSIFLKKIWRSKGCRIYCGVFGIALLLMTLSIQLFLGVIYVMWVGGMIILTLILIIDTPPTRNKNY